MKHIGIFMIAVLASAVILSGCGENESQTSSSKNTVSSEKSLMSEVSKKESEQSKQAEQSSNPESSEKEEQSEKSEQTSEPKKEVDSSWFDDAVFVGDSVTLKLSYYADNGSLGKAEFLCAGSLGYGEALGYRR